MRYSDDLIEEIRMKNDIVDVISGYVKLQTKGSSYFGLCPSIMKITVVSVKTRSRCIIALDVELVVMYLPF